MAIKANVILLILSAEKSNPKLIKPNVVKGIRTTGNIPNPNLSPYFSINLPEINVLKTNSKNLIPAKSRAKKAVIVFLSEKKSLEEVKKE
jgi:hypothetical protein